MLVGEQSSLYSAFVVSLRKLEDPNNLALTLITWPNKGLQKEWPTGTVYFLCRTMSEYGESEMLLKARH